VQLIAEGLEQPTMIELIDQSGRQIHKIPLGGYEKNVHQSIDVAEFKSGMYYLRIYDRNGVITRKMVKI